MKAPPWDMSNVIISTHSASMADSGNWRLTFEFRDGNTYVLDYEDYH